MVLRENTSIPSIGAGFDAPRLLVNTLAQARLAEAA